MITLDKALRQLNALCDVAADFGINLSVVDWCFGFIVFENGNRVFDDNFTKCLSYICRRIENA